MSTSVALGLDFGTESVRALLVDLTGQERASAAAKYRSGQITETLPLTGTPLPAHYALQDPEDWITSARKAVRAALRASGLAPDAVCGIGVDFTSCTMLPARHDGTPLCRGLEFRHLPLAWPKLWKHHGAQPQTDRINAVAQSRGEPFLAQYGGGIGVEWFFPKVLETLEHAPEIYAATDVWIEAGDWFVWQLTGESEPVRSTCQAGYKGLWSAEHGFPSPDFFAELHPALRDVVTRRMPGRLLAPGTPAGQLCPSMARQLGLRAGTPVSTAIIDAHAGVPGAGAAEPGTLVMVLGTSSCHMLNSERGEPVPGVAGMVRDGILPGYYGYETGQAAVGDAFDWLRRLCGEKDFTRLGAAAERLPPGAEGVTCVDWLNGCRTPLMDHRLTGSFHGLTLRHGPPHLYRALLEATAYGVRWIVEGFQKHAVPVTRYVATGGLPHHNPLVAQIYADVLGAPVTVPETREGPALGAAILGALAGGAFPDAASAIGAMAASRPSRIVQPDARHTRAYESGYRSYRKRCAEEERRIALASAR